MDARGRIVDVLDRLGLCTGVGADPTKVYTSSNMTETTPIMLEVSNIYCLKIQARSHYCSPDTVIKACQEDSRLSQETMQAWAA